MNIHRSKTNCEGEVQKTRQINIKRMKEREKKKKKKNKVAHANRQT